MKPKRLLAVISLLLIFSACKKLDDNSSKSSDKELISLSFEASLNPSFLTETIHANISTGMITVEIPDTMDVHSLIASFTFKGKEVLIGSVTQVSGVTSVDLTMPIQYVVYAEDGSSEVYLLEVKRTYVPEPAVAHIYIETDNNAPIDSKDNYVGGLITIDGMHYYDDYSGRMKIKGRGNSTWGFPKKPYRFKLDAASPVLGLPAAKDWILLANYLDGTLMCNAIAMKAGQLLEMPFTNHILPVDVTLNGKYVGSYVLTEQKEVGENRIDIGEDGVLLELDTYFDESWKFYSDKYQLPVMVQYPELDKISKPDADQRLNEIKNDFEIMENAVADASFPNNDFLNYLDATAMVRYLILYNLTLNEEINHPKSTYIYKKKDGKYSLGPIWDFDWAFGYEGNSIQFSTPGRPLFWTGGKVKKGTVFFSRVMQSPAIRTLFKTEWAQFKSQKMPQLMEYIETYSGLIRDSYDLDHNLWKIGRGDIDVDMKNIKSWFNDRVSYLDSYVSTF